MRRVQLHLRGERRARSHHRHLAAEHVDEVGQLVEREPPQQVACTRDSGVPREHRRPHADGVGAKLHRPQLVEVERLPSHADPALPVDDGPARAELDRDRRGHEEGGSERQADAREEDVERATQRVPSAFSQVRGTPRRR